MWFCIVLFVLVIAAVIAVQSTAVQTYLAQKATGYLAKKTGAKVSIERVKISFFNRAEFVNFYMSDLNGDTMIYTKDLEVKVRVFKLIGKQVSISSIAMDNAIVHLYRDSTGTKMNLAEVLKKLQSTDTTTVKKPAPFTWNIDLKRVDLNNTDFRYLDEKGHVDLKVLVSTCQVNLSAFDIPKKLIALKSVGIEGADVTCDLLPHEKKPDTDSNMFHFLLNGPKITFQTFTMVNSRFRMNDHNVDTIKARGIDFKHLDIKGINFFVDNGSLEGDTILANIKMLTAKDRSGLTVQNLNADARISVNEITLKNLDLQTPNSHIKNYLSLNYNGFRDFKDFVNKVTLHTRLDGSEISFIDINYFVPKLDKYLQNTIQLAGSIDGKVNNLRGKNVSLSLSETTFFKGDFTVYGLPDIYETSMNLRVKRIATNMDDIRQLFPSAKIPPNLNSLGQIYFEGSFDGFLTDFVTKGKLVTSIGSATSDVNFKYDKEHNKSAYSGALSLNDFNLGRFFGDEVNLGKISMEGKIDSGAGLTLESLRAKLDGNVSSMTIRGYDYKDIKVKGFVLQKSFNGELNVRDQYLDMDFTGKVNLTNKIPEFNFNANIQYAHLNELHLTKQDVQIAGIMNSNFTGNNPDNMLGSISLKNFMIIRDTMHARIDNMKVDARLLSSEAKSIKVTSEYGDVDITGNFTLKELPKALIAFARYTFTRDYIDTTGNSTTQDFTLKVNVKDMGSLSRIITPNLLALKNAVINGNFNSRDHALNLTGNIENIVYGNYTVKNLGLTAATSGGSFNFRTTADKVFSGDSVLLDSVSAISRTVADWDIKFDIYAGNKAKNNHANLVAYLTPETNKAIVRLQPGEFKLGNYNWRFDPDNSIEIQGKRISSHNVVFRSAEQTIYISAFLKDDTSTSVKVTLDNTSIADFMGLFTAKLNDLKGHVNGKIEMDDIFYKPEVFADLVIDEFEMGDELIGDVDIESRLDETGKNMKVFASVKSQYDALGNHNDIEARGIVSIDPENPNMRIDVNLNHLNLNFLNYWFFEKYVKDVHGYATAAVTVYGTPKKPLLTGTVNLVDDTVTVSFINTRYHVHNQVAHLDEHGFDLSGINVYDINNKLIQTSYEGDGNTNQASRINHESFKKFRLDLYVTASEGSQFLNTTEKQSPNFYGVAYGSGWVTFKGNINTPKIEAYAKTTRNTFCRLPISSTYETNRYSFYKFIDKNADTSAVATTKGLKLNGVDFKLQLDVTPDARMDIILDPVTGDVLTSYGSGNLLLHIPRNDNMTVVGEYKIDHGSYHFTLQNVASKDFEITKGSTINFNGSAYKALLDVNAVYQKRVQISDLISDLIGTNTSNSAVTGSTGSQLASAAQAHVPIKLLLNLSGVLERPTIAFDIQADDVDPSIRSYVDQKLALLRNNESELNKQVFGLLVMNRFIPQSSSAGDAISNSSYLGGTTVNTVSEFLLSQLSSHLSNLLDNSVIKNLDINIGYQQFDQQNLQSTINTTQPSFDTRRELQLALQQRLLNNRLIINAGGNLDIGNSTTIDNTTGSQVSNKSVIPTGDFQIEYVLTPDGTWRAKVFNRTNYDYYTTRNTNRTGIGISYTKEFDKASDLFGKPGKKKKKDKGKDKENENKTPPAAPEAIPVAPKKESATPDE